MTNEKRAELQERLGFRRTALTAARAAYTALLNGGAKSYTIGSRELTRLDLDALGKEIRELERECDELEGQLAGGGYPRRAFGVIPRDW